PPLLPDDDDGILAVKQLMVLADGVMAAAATIIRELTRPPSSAAWLHRYRQKITHATEALDTAVAGRDFAFRNCFIQADIAIVVTWVDMCGATMDSDAWNDRLPRLARYVARLDERPSFVATRPAPMHFDAATVYG